MSLFITVMAIGLLLHTGGAWIVDSYNLAKLGIISEMTKYFAVFLKSSRL